MSQHQKCQDYREVEKNLLSSPLNRNRTYFEGKTYFDYY